jgi:hypothetical protein
VNVRVSGVPGIFLNTADTITLQIDRRASVGGVCRIMINRSPLVIIHNSSCDFKNKPLSILISLLRFFSLDDGGDGIRLRIVGQAGDEC